MTTLPSDHIIHVDNVSFRRGSKTILKDINLSIARGKITAIMGPSGTGKTTLLNLFSAQLKPDQGTVSVNGIDINSLPRKELYKLRTKMGMLFQSGALFTELSVFDNVAFPIREHTQLSESVIRDIVLLKLEAVGLRGACHMMPAQLSGGMARRVSLARAVALDPDIVMYDEPFTGQDPIAMAVIAKLILILNQAFSHTSIIVSHDIAETCAIADTIYLLSGSEIVAHGTPDDLSCSDNPAVKQFFKGLPDGLVPFHYPALSCYDELLKLEY